MFVPEPFPDGEEAGCKPEPYERGDPEPFEATNDGVVYRDVDETEWHVLFEYLFVTLLAGNLIERQIMLHKVVQ